LLESMTGYGEAQCRQDGLAVSVEIRTVNNRFLKLSVRTTEGYASIEPMVEAAVRAAVHRGTVQVNVRVDRKCSPDDYQINVDVLNRYRRQLASLRQEWGIEDESSLESLLALPGVICDASNQAVDAAADWPFIQGAVQAALDNLARMRREEGRAMAADLAVNCRLVAECLDRIERRAPLVAGEYRDRLFDRLGKTLAELRSSLDPADLVKEVCLFADRADTSEEIVRLRSHLEQFEATMNLPESSGRKLDFLTQEMFREANTIGSKANDVEIVREVIEIKTAVERIREMIQNIE